MAREPDGFIPHAVADGRKGNTTAVPIAIPASAAEVAEQQRLVEQARLSADGVCRRSRPQKTALREWSPETRALFIVPQFLRGALVFGVRAERPASGAR